MINNFKNINFEKFNFVKLKSEEGFILIDFSEFGKFELIYMYNLFLNIENEINKSKVKISIFSIKHDLNGYLDIRYMGGNMKITRMILNCQFKLSNICFYCGKPIHINNLHIYKKLCNHHFNIYKKYRDNFIGKSGYISFSQYLKKYNEYK